MLGGHIPAPFFIQSMIEMTEILFVLKYAICVLLLFVIILAPAWIARQNGKGKPDMHAVRLASWIFGWSLIAWIWSLFWATRK
jgi:hypothetical protein